MTSAVYSCWIIVIFAGHKDSHKSLDKFEFRRDSPTDCGVSCPRASEKSTYNLAGTLAPSFLIGSSSFLQVNRTTCTINAGMSPNFYQI